MFAFVSSFFGKWKIYILAGAAITVVVIGALANARRKGKTDAQGEMAIDAIRRIAEGAKAAAKAHNDRKAGKTPEQIVRDNDGDWQ